MKRGKKWTIFCIVFRSDEKKAICIEEFIMNYKRTVAQRQMLDSVGPLL